MDKTSSSIDNAANFPKGNRGEWGEVYAFFKLLGDRVLFQCDQYLKKNDGIIEFNGIHRIPDKASDSLHYIYDENKKYWLIENVSSHIPISPEECAQEALKLLSRIKEAKETTIHFPDSYAFLKDRLLSSAIKASSQEKKDIELDIIERLAGTCSCYGFSIKSLLGQNPTLLNPSKKTCFTFKISGISDTTATDIQGYSVKEYEYSKIPNKNVTSIVTQIREKGGQLDFHETNNNLSESLGYIDTKMEEILAHYVLDRYTDQTDNKHSIKSTTQRIAAQNPINFHVDDTYSLYEYKIKKFLEAVALGLTPNKPWRGIEDANGGYIIIKSSGDLVAFLIYDRKLFLEYLFNHTKIECPDIGKLNPKKKRGEQSPPVGRIYEKNGELFISLPLQIRFITNG